MTEVVRPRDGAPVALHPCPAWCSEGQHFAEGAVMRLTTATTMPGTEIAVPTAYPFLGLADGDPRSCGRS